MVPSCGNVIHLHLTDLSFQTGSRCFLMSSRMESSHIQKLKGFPGMFSCNKVYVILKYFRIERTEHCFSTSERVCSVFRGNHLGYDLTPTVEHWWRKRWFKKKKPTFENFDQDTWNSLQEACWPTEKKNKMIIIIIKYENIWIKLWKYF